MNNKNFIEVLRQKREEYGVTQTRLAVACGISRTYFNQIENGSAVPSAELKQTEYYGAAEPPVRCGGSHLSGLTEPIRSLG